MDYISIPNLFKELCITQAPPLTDFSWYRECINYLISNGIHEPHIKGNHRSPALIHPLLAFMVVIHFRYVESLDFVYKLLEFHKDDPLFILLQNLPEKVESTDTSSYVYVLKNEITGLTKIGMTNNPKRRLKELDTGNGVPLTYIFCEFVPGGSIFENKLHQIYANKCTTGEWFNLTDDDINNVIHETKKWCNEHSNDSTDTPSKFCHRICEHCGRQFGVYYSDIIRGKGMFCGNACAASHRKTKKYDKICKVCQSPFKTIIQAKDICSTECERMYRLDNPEYVVNIDTLVSYAPKGLHFRACECCGKIFSTTSQKMLAGSSICCSKQCTRNMSKETIKYKKECKHCGGIFYTRHKLMEFCSIECEITNTGDADSFKLSSEAREFIELYKHSLINNAENSNNDKTNASKEKIRHCEECGNSITIKDRYEMRRGAGVFCCHDCSFKNIHNKTMYKVCKVCGDTYKTMKGIDYCCEECKDKLLQSST